MSIFRTGLAAAVAMTALSGAGLAAGAEPPALLAQYRCAVCHADRETLTGPSWADIAARYRGQRQAEVIVSAKIRAGAHGSGLWHMPPHPEVSKTDAATMASYILSIKE